MSKLPIVGTLKYETRTGKWKYVLLDQLQIRFPDQDFGEHVFTDKNGTVWGHVYRSVWTIMDGYAWDGASCAINFETTLAASLWHDCAGQFRHLPCIAPKLPGSLWNKLFADIIRAQGSPKIAAIYHFGLMLGNPFYSAIGKLFGAKRTGRCLIHHSNNKKPATDLDLQRF